MTVQLDDGLSEPAQIAAILGLPRARMFDDLMLVDSLRAGVPAESARRAARALDPTGRWLGPYDLVPKATLHRRLQNEQPLGTDASETLWRVIRVFIEARRIYVDAAEAMEYLFRPHPLLKGRRPFDLARDTMAGAELVMTLLARAEAGVAV